MANFLDGLLSGKNAFTQTTASFAQPAVGANVTVPVIFSGWTAVGLAVFLEVGGNYQVVSIPNDSSIQIKNLGSSGNAAVSASVPPGRMAPAGAPGANGTSGAAVPAPDYIATSSVTLSGAQSVDAVSVPNGKLVLCTAQTDTTQNGYWLANTGGAWTRPTFYNSDATIAPLVGLASGCAISGTYLKGIAYFQRSGTTLAGAKVFAPVLAPSTINVKAAPWFLKGDGSDENTAMQAVFAYANTAAAVRGCALLFPPGRFAHTAPLPVSPYVELLGVGKQASVIEWYNSGTTALRCDNLQLISANNVNTPHAANISNIQIKNYADGSTAKWSAANSSFVVGQQVTPKNAGCRLLKLVTAGTTGAQECIGELQPVTSVAMKLVGTANASAGVKVKIIAGGLLGTMTFQVSTNNGSSYGATQTTVAGPSYTYIIPGFGGTFGVAMADSPNASPYVAADVYAPAPRVELIGTPPGADAVIDVAMVTAGVLGTAQFQIGTGTAVADKWKYGATVANGATQTTGGASAAYYDYAVPGWSGCVLRFHTGVYTTTGGGTWFYFTPSQVWSMQIGTQITDGTCVWQVVEGPACIRLQGRGDVVINKSWLEGGMYGVINSGGEAVTVRDCTIANCYSSPIWCTNGDGRLGEAGGFTNQVTIEGNCQFFSKNWGMIHDGGITFHVARGLNVQSAPAGFMYWAGVESGSACGLYVETSRGVIRNSCFFGRSGVGTGGFELDFSRCFLGTKGPCAMDVWSVIGLRANSVLTGANGVAGFVGIASCSYVDITGTNIPNNVPLVDANPQSGEVTDQQIRVTKLLETQPDTAISIVNGQNNNVAFNQSVCSFSSATLPVKVSGLAPTGFVTPPQGQRVRIYNFSGQPSLWQHASGLSTAAYRLLMRNGRDKQLVASRVSWIEFAYFGAWCEVDSSKAAVYINNQIGTTYSVVADDFVEDTLVRCTNAAAITVTLNQGLCSAGQTVSIMQGGAGQVTLVAGSGVLPLQNAKSNLDRAQNSVLNVTCLDATTGATIYLVSGDMQ